MPHSHRALAVTAGASFGALRSAARRDETSALHFIAVGGGSSRMFRTLAGFWQNQRPADAALLKQAAVALDDGPAHRSARAVRDAIESESARHEPRTVAVAYRDLETGKAVSVRGDEVLHAASTMKVPVMIALFRQADAGELDLEGDLLLENSFASIVDGSPYHLDPDDDSDAELYEEVGERVPVRRLLWRMIARSSNLATNALIEVVGAERVQRTVRELGAVNMQVLRGVEDGIAFRAGLNNTATASDLAVLMTAIADRSAASERSCAEMIGILAEQEFDDLIPAGLPAGTVVAHKTGSITGIRHDAAIVDPYGEWPYVLVVLTQGFEDPETAARAIAEVAWRVHSARIR